MESKWKVGEVGMKDLRPCPFCGREVRIEGFVEEIDYEICWIEHIEKEPICFLHSARGYIGKQKDLIELWNRRANDDFGRSVK